VFGVLGSPPPADACAGQVPLDLVLAPILLAANPPAGRPGSHADGDGLLVVAFRDGAGDAPGSYVAPPVPGGAICTAQDGYRRPALLIMIACC
jgi:hypothetical protein